MTCRFRGLQPAFAAAACVCFLSSCSVGPRYVRPDIPAPQNWRGQSVQPEGSTGAAWPSLEWWRGFNSPQLDELITRSRAANDDLAAAIARVREADALARIAGAALLPSFDLNGSATRQRQKTAQLTPTGQLISPPSTFNIFAVGVGASYEIDFWGRNRALHDASVMAAAASRYDRVTVELTVMTSVASTYFQVLELRDRLTVADDNLTSAREILKGLAFEAQVGTLTALDVAQQETTVATLEAAIPPLRQQYLQTLDALAILVGGQPQAVSVAAGTLADLTAPAVQPGMPSQLLARRPDIAQAEAQLIAANADIVAARAAFFPNITLTGQGGFASTSLTNFFNPVNRVFNLTAGLTQPIFQGGALVGQYAYNKARYAELLAVYHKAVIAAFGNVEDALAAVEQTAAQQQRQQEAVTKARRAYDLTQAQFRAGTINILTVLNTETALFTAEDTLVQVRYSHLNALIALFGALGGGWQRT